MDARHGRRCSAETAAARTGTDSRRRPLSLCLSDPRPPEAAAPAQLPLRLGLPRHQERRLDLNTPQTGEGEKKREDKNGKTRSESCGTDPAKPGSSRSFFGVTGVCFVGFAARAGLRATHEKINNGLDVSSSSGDVLQMLRNCVFSSSHKDYYGDKPPDQGETCATVSQWR